MDCQFMNEETTRGSIKNPQRKINKQNFPKQFLDVVSSSEVFLYPLLLPARPFRVVESQSTFLPSEERLIAIGLQQFDEYLKETKANYVNRDLVQVCSLIVKHMMPTIPDKEVKKLYDFVQRRRFVKYSPIHYYFHRKQAPPTEHFVIPYNVNMVRPPNRQPVELLPSLWKEVIHPTVPPVKMWYFFE